MNNSVYKTEWYENALLRVVRIILLFTMTISILVTVGFGFYGVYKFLKPISETVPIKILPPESVNLQKFIDEIDPAKKLNDRPIQADVNTDLNQKITTLKYLEEVTRLYRCSFEFGRSLGVNMDEFDSAGATRQIEILRANVEDRASFPIRGDEYVNDLVEFICKVLSNQDVINLRRSKKIENVFISAFNFHLNEWDRIKNDEALFIAEEEFRFSQEGLESELNKVAEKAEGIAILYIAGFAFLIFMCIAVYLIFSRIERNLRIASMRK